MKEFLILNSIDDEDYQLMFNEDNIFLNIYNYRNFPKMEQFQLEIDDIDTYKSSYNDIKNYNIRMSLFVDEEYSDKYQLIDGESDTKYNIIEITIGNKSIFKKILFNNHFYDDDEFEQIISYN